MRAGGTIWLTGLSGAGKSTIAIALDHLLRARGVRATMLDGDDLRRTVSRDLGFSVEDRATSVRRAGRLAVEAATLGELVIAALVSPAAAVRHEVRNMHSELGVAFAEVHVSTSLAECERRDPKGLYARARRGEIADMTGIGAAYEVPTAPECVVSTVDDEPLTSARRLLRDLERLPDLGRVLSVSAGPDVRGRAGP